MPTVDYADPRNWSLHPGATGAAADYFQAAAQAGPADLFYIHPTTYQGPDGNQALGDMAAADWTDRSTVIRHLVPFAGLCRLYAPRYRQASVSAMRAPGGQGAFAIAYADVAAAFRRYLASVHGGRRFILFGHSQGALHGARLLREIVEPEGLMPQLIAAYLPGIGLSTGLFGPVFRHAVPCTAPAQTGCIMGWNSFIGGGDTASFLTRTRLRDAALLSGATGQPICINPLSFDAAVPDVPAAANPGSLVGPLGALPLAPLQPGLVGACCRAGVLEVGPAPDPVWQLNPLPGGNMHMHDIALFHAAIRHDAQRRIAMPA